MIEHLKMKKNEKQMHDRKKKLWKRQVEPLVLLHRIPHHFVKSIWQNLYGKLNSAPI